MLVLRRKPGERIVVPGCGVTLTVLAVEGKSVRLGISAPATLAVYREEVWRARRGRRGASATGQGPR
jgi:carbon storage regulator